MSFMADELATSWEDGYGGFRSKKWSNIAVEIIAALPGCVGFWPISLDRVGGDGLLVFDGMEGAWKPKFKDFPYLRPSAGLLSSSGAGVRSRKGPPVFAPGKLAEMI